MEETIAIILAAGKGTRMKSNKSKLIHKLYGKELIKRVVETTKKAGVDDIITIAKEKSLKKGSFHAKIFLEKVIENADK